MKRLFWAAAFLLLAAAVSAQSLAEIAKKEKERRKGITAPASKTVTDTELRRIGGPRVPTRPTSQTESDESTDEDTTDSQDSEEEAAPDPRQSREYWQGRLRPIDERIRKLEADLASPTLDLKPARCFEAPGCGGGPRKSSRGSPSARRRSAPGRGAARLAPLGFDELEDHAARPFGAHPDTALRVVRGHVVRT